MSLSLDKTTNPSAISTSYISNTGTTEQKSEGTPGVSTKGPKGGDGFVDAKPGLSDKKMARVVNSFWKGFDTNKDKKISGDELKDVAAFEKLDVDKSGEITRDDIASMDFYNFVGTLFKMHKDASLIAESQDVNTVGETETLAKLARPVELAKALIDADQASVSDSPAMIHAINVLLDSAADLPQMAVGAAREFLKK